MYLITSQILAVADQTEVGEGGSNFACKCISTTAIGAPIYICPRVAIPHALPATDY